MEARFDNTSSNINPFMISHDQRRDNYEHYSPSSTDKGSESPSSSFFNDHPILHKISSVVTSSKRSGSTGRRAVLKRVVTIPIKEVEAGSRLKGDMSCSSTTTPPSDSWAWRKYGQKPIKGSPYPRGYYRCSSSKGCPARKQVERSRVDPTMLVITYSAEHSHPWPPPSRNHHQQHQQQSSIRRPILIETPPAQPDPDPEAESEDKFANLVEDTMIAGDEFRWFGDMETTTSTVLENPIFSECGGVNSTSDMAMVFPMREEDESLFADLGELPECSVVFRHQRGVGPELEIC